MGALTIIHADDRFDGIDPEAVIGGKAAKLWALGQAFPIPNWFAITGDGFLGNLTSAQRQAFDDGAAPEGLTVQAALRSAIAAAVARLAPHGQRLAVRSSAIGEDGATASHAGQLQSCLNVAPGDVPDAVVKVWTSAFSDGVAAYRTHKAETRQLVPAVLVQLMVDPDAAGVAFGCDPVTGDADVCVVSATAGVGDKLVGGEINGALYRVPRDPKAAVTGDALISSPQLRAVETLLRRAEDHFGGLQDMEWCLSKDRLYLLQSRPITTLDNRGEAIVWDNSNIVESYSGVTSPLTFSFARYVYGHVYIGFCRLMGVSRARIATNHNRFFICSGRCAGMSITTWSTGIGCWPCFRVSR
jgi:pyruvate,water dikinase